MREFFISILSGVLVWVMGVVCDKFLAPDGSLNFAQLWGYFVVFGFTLFCSIWIWFNRRRNKLAASQKFDFKFFAESDNLDLSSLYGMFGKSSAEDIGGTPNFIKKGATGYISAHDFFLPSSTFMNIFRCRSIRTSQKSGNLFLQLSYLPLDKDENTLIVKRLPDNHSGQSMLEESPKLALISFSPVPPRYHANNFDESVSYNNEVPVPWDVLKGTTLQFEELGAVIRRDKKGAIYFFYVFAVRYPTISFFEKIDGESCLKYLFYENEESYKEKAAFIKDHDMIVDVAKLSDIKEFILNKTLPRVGRWPFSSVFWRKLHLRFTLSHTKIKEAEKCVIQNLLC